MRHPAQRLDLFHGDTMNGMEQLREAFLRAYEDRSPDVFRKCLAYVRAKRALEVCHDEV